MRYKVNSISIRGLGHNKNEDNCFISSDYIIVADGMGGECDGDIASSIAVKAISETLSENLHQSHDERSIKELGCKAIAHADSKIREYIDKNPGSFGMGTTVLLTIRKDNRLYISWCGDSRCYSYNKWKLKSLTKDHSYVQELIDLGQMTEMESYSHPDNYIITRYVGGGEDTCNPDFMLHELSDSEMIILCSDGLSGYCNLSDIEDAISANKDMSALPEKLKDLAVNHGSDDDITIVVLYPDISAYAKKDETIFSWLKKVMRL